MDSRPVRPQLVRESQPADPRRLTDVLAIRARDGDSAAFTALVEAMHGRALRFVGQLTGASADDVEDITQEAWIRTYRALDRYDATRPFETWFFTILANCGRTWRSRQRRWWQRAAPLDESTPDPAPDALLQTSVHADVMRVRRVLDTLPLAQRETFLLHYVEGLSYEEIADATGAKVSACKMRAKRAMDAVKAALEQTNDDA
jgi:RNA polymerase sigma factor (sigma-70 family)